MTATLVETDIQVILDGKMFDLGSFELPAGRHMQLEVRISEAGDCDCAPPLGQLPKGTQLTTEEQLDLLPVGTITADKDHDDWEKTDTGEWVHKQGPHVRAKTLVALWGPMTLVNLP